MTTKINFITGKDIMKKWNIDPIDLIFIVENHGLNVLDQDLSAVGTEDVLSHYFTSGEFNGLSNELFSMAQVEELYKKYGNPMPDKTEFISFKKVEERWNRPENYLYTVIDRYGYDIGLIDRFGQPIDFILIMKKYCDGKFDNVPDQNLFFSLKEVEQFEKDHPEVVSKSDHVA